MARKCIFPAILGCVGLLSLFGSFYINSQVEAGKQQVSSAEKNVNIGKQLFSLSPESEAIGDTISRPVTKKIDQGKEDIAFYSSLSTWLEIGGILCIVVAIAYALLSKTKKS